MFAILARLSFIAFLLVGQPVSAADKPVINKVRAYVLDCGKIEFNDMSWFADTGELDGHPGHLNAMCVLVGHPKGWLLWDTGVQAKKYEGYEFLQKTSIAAQLQQIGLTSADVTYVAFSHFHLDHTGNANEFTGATWLLQDKEWQWANSKPTPFGVDPQTFSESGKAKLEIFSGDRDVFGDGKVKILFAPGHTPGHQVLMIKLASGKNVIFSGDLYHQAISREKKLVPAFNVNRADTLASIDRIERIVKNQKATFVIQHELGDAAKAPAFPKYWE